MHEWFYEGERRPTVVSDELGMLSLVQLELVMTKASSPYTKYDKKDLVLLRSSMPVIKIRECS